VTDQRDQTSVNKGRSKQHRPGHHGLRPHLPGRPEPGEGPLRVSTLELFFDLVFAFTLTQLTERPRRRSSGPGWRWRRTTPTSRCCSVS
jgi:hypothetical protein